ERTTRQRPSFAVTKPGESYAPPIQRPQPSEVHFGLRVLDSGLSLHPSLRGDWLHCRPCRTGSHRVPNGEPVGPCDTAWLDVGQESEIRRLIEGVGRVPVERDTPYHEVIRKDGKWQTRQVIWTR